MTSKPKADKRPKLEEIETEPGAWGRFEHAVDAAVKGGPKHRAAKPKRVSAKKAVKRRD